MFAPVIGAAYTMTTKREAHWSEQTKAQNTEKGMYVGLKQPRGEGERYVTPARTATKETTCYVDAGRKKAALRISALVDAKQSALEIRSISSFMVSPQIVTHFFFGLHIHCSPW